MHKASEAQQQAFLQWLHDIEQYLMEQDPADTVQRHAVLRNPFLLMLFLSAFLAGRQYGGTERARLQMAQYARAIDWSLDNDCLPPPQQVWLSELQ